MRVMIIDDEYYVRQNLCSLLKDFEYIFEVIDFENPLPALDYLKRNEVDVIISDIRMPDMDGLEFFEIMHRQYPMTYLIIVSGFSDFEYAQKAITYGVKAFILKPVDEKELHNELIKALNIINKRASSKLAEISDEKEKAIETKERLERWIYSYLFGNNEKTDHDDIGDSVNWAQGIHTLCFVKTDGKLTDNILATIRDMIDVYLKKTHYYLITCRNGQDYILIFHCETCSFKRSDIFTLRIQKLLNNVMNLSINDLHINCYLAVSETGAGLEGLEKNHVQAESIMMMRFYTKCPTVLNIKDIEESFFFDRFFTNQKMILLENLILKRYWDCISDEFVEIFHNIYTMGLNSKYDITSVCKLCYNVIIKMIWRNDYQIASDTDKIIKRLSNMNNYFDIGYLKKDILFLLEAVSQAENSIKVRDDVVNDLIKFLNKNFDQDISFSELALSRYSISVEHLNRKFKKVMGKNLSVYLKELRIKKAAELLKDPSLSITDIAGMVGYNDISHFIHTFKKIQSETPGEYRKQITSDKN